MQSGGMPGPDPYGSLFVRRYGCSGPAIVLVHGLGASGRSWRPVVERLAPRARLLCPDLLGFGRSPWPAAAYSVEDHITALSAALDRHQPDRQPVVLAGHSTGAVLALEWAARQPLRFSGVLLISFPAYRSSGEAIAWIGSLSPLARATVSRPPWGELICGLMCACRPLWRRLMPALNPGIPADIARDYVLHNWVSYSSTLRNVVVQYRAAPAAARLAESGLPVRLLHGARDAVAPLDAVAELAARHSWPLDVITTGDHNLPVRRPVACAHRLRMLMRGSPPEGRAAVDRPGQRRPPAVVPGYSPPS